MKFTDLDWTHWQPVETATLIFVRTGGMVLLIRKRKGMGAGLLNAPGGRVDPGETPVEGAVREAREEVCITPLDPREAGVLNFRFTSGYSLRCHVFTASAYTGTPETTPEAIPLWMDEREMPYSQMWADDRIWYPLVLQNRHFTGRFLFDGAIMLGCELDVDPPSPPPAPASPDLAAQGGVADLAIPIGPAPAPDGFETPAQENRA
jgi:8-oxo-dGTP diphosphatase